MDELILQLKKEIIDVLNLAEVNVEDINADAPLFVEGLGLDSIDALELTVLLEKKYDLKINTADEGRMILYSVKSMAEFIRKNQKG